MSDPWWQTVGLVVLGAVLGILSNIAFEAWKDRKLNKASKKVLYLEMQLNLGIIKEFWNKVDLGTFDKSTPNLKIDMVKNDLEKVTLARRLIETPIPELQRGTFDSLVPILGKLLNENEVADIFLFYHNINKFETILTRLIKSNDLQRGEKVGWTFTETYRSIPFDVQAPSLWDDIKPIVEFILDRGNPLGSWKHL